jgi:hypothetical protein
MIVAGASLAVVLGQVLLAGPVAATGPWTPAFTLAPASPRWINDLSAAGGNVVTAWVSAVTTQPSVWVRESVTSGTTWLAPVRLAADTSMWAGQISLTSDAASGRHLAVWQELTSNGSAIFMSSKTFGSGSWTAPIQVSDNTGNSSATGPALVVTPAYYFLDQHRDPRLHNRRREAGRGIQQGRHGVVDYERDRHAPPGDDRQRLFTGDHVVHIEPRQPQPGAEPVPRSQRHARRCRLVQERGHLHSAYDQQRCHLVSRDQSA